MTHHTTIGARKDALSTISRTVWSCQVSFFRNYSPELLPAVKQVLSACETVSNAYLLCVHVNGFYFKDHDFVCVQ